MAPPLPSDRPTSVDSIAPATPRRRSGARRGGTPGALIPLRPDVTSPPPGQHAEEPAHDGDDLDDFLNLVNSLHQDHDLGTALDLLARGVCRLTGMVGCGVSLVLPSGDHQVAALAGDVEPLLKDLNGRLIPASLWLAVTRISEPLNDRLMHNPRAGVVFTTLVGRDGRVVGSVAAVLAPDAEPDPGDCQRLELFAVHAAVVVDQVRSQGALVQNVVLRERERAAEDLHDLVVQRIFAATLQLDMAQSLGMSDPARGRVDAVLTDLDELATEVRAAIRGARHDPQAPDTGARVEQAMLDAARTLGFVPQLSFAGDLDSITAHTASELEAVLARVLSSIAMDGTATRVLVALSVTDVSVTVEVDEHGGPVDAELRATRIGLADLQHRAGLVRGTCLLGVSPLGGATLRWSVPKV